MLSQSGRWVFAAMAAACFAAAATGLLARAANYMADRWAHETTGVAIVRILASEAPNALETAERAINGSPLVARAQIVTAERAAALLQQWGGGQVRASDLPPLQLVEVEFNLNAPREAPRRLEQELSRQGLAAQVVTPSASENEATQSARLLRYTALGGVIFITLLMAIIIALSARAIAQRRADLIRAMADIGASRDHAAQAASMEAVSNGFWAGVLGAGLAGFGAIAAIYALTPTSDVLEIIVGARPLDWAPIVLTPPLSAIVASLGARGAATRLHDRAARLA